jgi:hypothetical protein
VVILKNSYQLNDLNQCSIEVGLSKYLENVLYNLQFSNSGILTVNNEIYFRLKSDKDCFLEIAIANQKSSILIT